MFSKDELLPYVKCKTNAGKSMVLKMAAQSQIDAMCEFLKFEVFSFTYAQDTVLHCVEVQFLEKLSFCRLHF